MPIRKRTNGKRRRTEQCVVRVYDVGVQQFVVASSCDLPPELTDKTATVGAFLRAGWRVKLMAHADSSDSYLYVVLELEVR